jgi:lactate dehydrogenase-like 2-hydroxyacid dehydrogenase
MAVGEHRIVVTRRPPGGTLEWFVSIGDVWVWEENRLIPSDVLHEQVASATGLYCMLTDPIDEALLAAAPHLVAISQMAVGVDNVDLAAATRHGIPVGHTPGVLTEATADHAFALLLAAARRLEEAARYVAEGRWKQWDPDLLLGAEVHGTTLGIIGLGRIGRAVARRAAGFGMRVVYTKRTRDPEAEEELGVEYRVLDDLFIESDHIVVSAALTDETRGLIDAAALAAMKPTAILVNAARGPIVDTAALTDALRRGIIAGAALDVTDPEPLPADHPLVALPNCLVVPHIGSATVRTRVHMAEVAAANLVAALNGERMTHCANPQVYRPGTDRG